MQKRTRRVLFYFLTLLFSVATPFVILYALGYIPDIASWSFTPTGGFFVKTNEYGIRISINGRLEKETGFLARGALVTNLPPGVISVEVTKEGFHPWKKSVEIEKHVVQEFPFILLVPQSAETKIIAGTSTPSQPEPAPRMLLPNIDGSRLLWISEVKGRIAIRAQESAAGQDSRGFTTLAAGEKFETASWNAAGTAFIVAATQNQKRWHYVDTSNGKAEALFDTSKSIAVTESATSTVPGALRLKFADVKEVAWDPSSPAALLLRAGGKLYRWERPTPSAALLIDNIAAFNVSPEEILFVSQDGYLKRAGLDGSGITPLGGRKFSVDDKRQPKIEKNRDGIIALTDSGGNMYVNAAQENEMISVAKNVSRFRFSETKNILGYTENGKLMARFLEDEIHQPFRRKNSDYQIIDAIVPIEDFVWFDEEAAHIVFTTKDGVFITETDGRFGANTITLRTGRYLIAANPNDANSLYLTDGNAVEELTIK